MDQLTITPGFKKLTNIFLGIGLAALLYGVVTLFTATDANHVEATDDHGGHAPIAQHDAHADAHGDAHAEEAHADHGDGHGGHGDHAAHIAQTRFWSNLLINGLFFFGLAVAATFFMSLQYAAEAAWATVVKRVMEAIGLYMWVPAVLLVIVWLASTFGANHLYHWMDADAVAHDELLQHKTPFLNKGFWWIRNIIYLGVFIWFMNMMRKRSLQEDMEGGDHWFYKNQKACAGFLVFFAYTSTTASWDWIMSIDTHWFSTLFGWYTFSGWWISALTAMTLITLYLKDQGYLKEVNDSHIHDLGKWMFAISFLWTYLWFSQFMLIWYADIPEEVMYFKARIDDYPWIYFMMIFANFLFPMLILMDRDAKRSKVLLWFVGIVIFFAHWVDNYMLVTPGVMKGEGSVGFMELGMFIGFVGLFMKVVFKNLTKAPLVVKNHSYLDESIHFHQ